MITQNEPKTDLPFLQRVEKYENIFLDISQYHTKEYDKTITTSLEIMNECETNPDLSPEQKLLYVGKANYFLGYANKQKCNYLEAIQFYQKSYQCFSDINQPELYSQILINIGVVHRYLCNFELGFNYLIEALDYYLKTNDLKKIADVYSGLGNIYNDMDQIENALDSHLKALRIREELGEPNNLATAYNNIGTIYENNKQHDEALAYYLKAFKIKVNQTNSYSLGVTLHNIGKIYLYKAEFQQALDYLTQSLTIMTQIDNSLGICMNNNCIGEIYTKMGSHDLGIVHLGKSLAIAKEKNIPRLIQNNYLQFSKLYEAMGDFAISLEYHKNYAEMKEEVLNKENTSKFRQLKAKFELESKEKELEIYHLKNIELAKANEELKQAHADIISLERENSVFAMAVTANHELNQPLMVLNGNFDILLANIPDEIINEKMEKNIQRINSALKTIDQILLKFKDTRTISFENYTEDVQMVVFKPE